MIVKYHSEEQYAIFREWIDRYTYEMQEVEKAEKALVKAESNFSQAREKLMSIGFTSNEIDNM